jgi:primary-amine oxidase
LTLEKQDTFITTYVNISSGLVEKTERMSPEYHGNVDFEEVVHVEEMVMKTPSVLEEIEKLKLPSHLTVVPEAWGFGTDGVDDARRQYQVYMFVGEGSKPDSNHYARPLAFSPVVDAVEMRVTRIDKIPTGEDWETAQETKPWRYVRPNEYAPEDMTLRTDLQPLHVVQPAGPSYAITSDNVVKWQKWHARIGFNYREGVVLRDVRYDGRPVFYRISLSEMTVPYADPRSPYHRKQAFDLGDVGAGLVSNNLKLGCDCLGSITYLDGLLVSPKGEPVVKENVVCIHEQDGGIGWKHSNYRTERKSAHAFQVPGIGLARS